MDKERKEIELLADAFNNYMDENRDSNNGEALAEIAINLGYRKSPPPSKEECTCPDDDEPHIHNIPPKEFSGYSTEMPNKLEFPTLHALDEEKLHKLWFEFTDNKEMDSWTARFLKEICATFGQSPMASEEELAIKLCELEHSPIHSIGIFWANYAGKDVYRHKSQAILKFLKERK